MSVSAGWKNFFSTFDQLARTSVDGFMPLLHFECHGSEDGFELSDGSFIEWAKLKEPLTQLNIVTGLNLMVCVAACTGGALLKVVTALDRAPLWVVTSTGRRNTLPCWTEVECHATTTEATILHGG